MHISINKEIRNIIDKYSKPIFDFITIQNRSFNICPFEDRLELADFEDIMKKLVRKKIDIPEIVEETPLLFLILDEAGNSKYTKRFSQSRAINETLVYF